MKPLRIALIFLTIFALLAPLAGASYLLGTPKFQAFDADGNPLTGGLLYTYSPGTTTDKATYSDIDLTAANANPVVLDSRGEATIYLAGPTKLVLKTSTGSTIWTMDDVDAVPQTVTANLYYADASESDQGAAGSGRSLKDIIDAVGTSQSATIVLSHSGTGNTTSYVVGTDETVPSNYRLVIEEGALIDVDGAAVTLTLDSPEQIEAGNRQQIFTGAGSVAFAESIGKGYSSWFSTLEKAQESDIRHLIINADYSLSATVTFDQNDTTIEWTNDAKVSGASDTTNVIAVSGDNCKILSPYIEGPGTFQQDGTGGALIYITGDNCSVSDGRFVDPPGRSITFVGVTLGVVSKNIFTGGPTSYSDTKHMHVRVEGSSGLTIQDNDFIPSAGGGYACQVIYLGSIVTNSHVIGNYINGAWDEGIYHDSGSDCNISNNIIIDPGLAIGGGMKISGPRSVAIGNEIYAATATNAAGIRLYTAEDCVIQDNIITGVSSSGITIESGNAGTIAGNLIANNIINDYGIDGVRYGIYITNTDVDYTQNNKVINNIIRAGSTTTDTKGIYIAAPDVSSANNQINGNNIDTCGSIGIHIMDKSGVDNNNIISNNIVDSPTQNTAGEGIRIDSSVGTKVLNNHVLDSSGTGTISPGIRFLSCDEIEVKGNRIQDAATPYGSVTGTNTFGETFSVYFGTVAAGDSAEKPLFIAHRDLLITDVVLMNASDIAANGSDYCMFTLKDKGSDGTGTDSISSFNTNSVGDNVSFSDFDGLSMYAQDPLDSTNRVLAEGDVVSFSKGGVVGAGKATDEMMITVKYLEY